MIKKIIILSLVLVCFWAVSLVAQDEKSSLSPETATEETAVDEATQKTSTSPIKYVEAALAVGKIGSAAMGAMSENAELSGKALPFVGLAEGICLWGFLVGLLIIVL